MAGGFSAAELVKALRKQVTILEDDLRARVDGADVDARQPEVGERWKAEYAAALKAQRTAASWQAWRDERVTQAAVAWVLLTVFARYCEDHALVSKAWIGGPDADARQQALDARRAYFTAHPEHTDREWLETIIEHFARMEATRGLVDAYSPLHQVAPSGDAARGLLEFWWERDASGRPLWSFVGVDTRFLGDVYQDLSEFAKKTYALLQTPEFVEEFILDQTLEPALAERPLDGFTVIDPTCGSGHFLLGAFRRLLERWQREAPALGNRVLVQKALAAVYGVDINPFAVAIARFRLMVAALDASGDKSIEKLIDIELNLAAGDSLLWGSRKLALSQDLLELGQEYATRLEDRDALGRILQREYDVVVGNPPYITVKDRALNQSYRSLYNFCRDTYALTVPFMELFFDLAYSGADGRAPGWTGQITANTFMTRRFGVALVERYLWTRDLRAIVDTSGVHIPGHGTPTVILVGRNKSPVGQTVRAVLSLRGESGIAKNPEKSEAWVSIVENISNPGFANDLIDVVDLPRSELKKHPWSLSGGGSGELASVLESRSEIRLGRRAKRIGYFGDSHADSAFYLSRSYASRLGRDSPFLRNAVRGEDVRNWAFSPSEVALLPYTSKRSVVDVSDLGAPIERHLWRLRTTLGNRSAFGGGTYFTSGRAWHSWHQLPKDDQASEYSIAFSDMSTGNHFALDVEGSVFNRHAPVIKLSAGASLDDHLEILGVLNCSIASFWLKRNSHNKGEGGGARVDAGYAARGEAWRESYEYIGATLKKYPLPNGYAVSCTREIVRLSEVLLSNAPDAVVGRGEFAADRFSGARTEYEKARSLLVAHQEELDWAFYRIYGLIDQDLTYTGDVPEVRPEERAFAIRLAREVESSDERSTWFDYRNHGYGRVTEIPDYFPEDYQDIIQRRLDAIDSNPHLRLLEVPTYKRGWAVESWERRMTEALSEWLLDRLEDPRLWFDGEGRPKPRTVVELADQLDRDGTFASALRVWASSPDASVETALAALLDGESVPYLSALRYRPSGLIKKEAWEDTWASQRRVDRGETLALPIPVPPRFKKSDFVKDEFWSKRGELDIESERFISYQFANRDNDDSQLLGWAGWDHAQQAFALAGLIDSRITDDGWDQTAPDKLVPMLAGLAELLPWVQQWHGEIDPEYGTSDADDIAEVLRSHSADLGVTADDLAAWRPPTAATRGRRTSKKENSPA